VDKLAPSTYGITQGFDMDISQFGLSLR